MMRPNKRSRLTDLHETELSHILSRLPTEEAVRTSILSKDWRNKWTSSYTVDIVDCHNDEPESFVDFMNTRLPSLRHIRNFRLECDFDLDHTLAWIDIALTHNLESLDLEFEVSEFDIDQAILPRNLLNDPWLQDLRLYLEGTMNVAANNLAPNLTSLHMWGITIVNNHSTSTSLKFSFPLLETFSIRKLTWSNVAYVEIDAPSLTTFDSYANVTYFIDGKYEFVLLSPRIETFSYEISLNETITVNGSSIVYADLDSGYVRGCSPSEAVNYGLRVRKMVTELTNLQELKLTGYLNEVLPLGYPLPLFDKLKKLALDEPIKVELLLELLSKAPSLKVLAFCMGKWVDFDYGAIDPVPFCIVSHLERVRIRYYARDTIQYDLLNFLLKNGKKLKKLIMVSDHIDKQNEVEEYVSTLGISGLVLDQFHDGY